MPQPANRRLITEEILNQSLADIPTPAELAATPELKAASVAAVNGALTTGDLDVPAERVSGTLVDSQIPAGIARESEIPSAEDFAASPELAAVVAPALTRARSATAEDFGAVGDGSADDTVALQAAINAGVANRCPVIVSGTYRTTAGLLAVSDYFELRGLAATVSKIRMASGNAHVLEVRSASSGGTGSAGSGSVTDVELLGNMSRPTDGKAALMLYRMRKFSVRRVTASYRDIGLDMDANCYGTSFQDCTTTADNVNVGLMLRGAPPSAPSTAGSGSDNGSINGWYGGGIASVWAEPNAGGYHLWGGQFGGGWTLPAEDDTLGSLVLGRSYKPVTTLAADVAAGATTLTVTDAATLYAIGHMVIGSDAIAYTGKSGNTLTGVTGVTAAHTAGDNIYTGGTVAQIDCTGVSWEGTTRRHAIRGWGPGVGWSFTDCSFNSNGTNRIMRVLKLTRGGTYQIAFRRCGIQGTWTGAGPLELTNTPNFSGYHLEEQGTYGTATFNGVSHGFGSKPMSAFAGLARAFATTEDKLYFGGRWMRWNAGVLESSADGTTWAAV